MINTKTKLSVIAAISVATAFLEIHTQKVNALYKRGKILAQNLEQFCDEADDSLSMNQQVKCDLHVDGAKEFLGEVIKAEDDSDLFLAEIQIQYYERDVYEDILK